VNLSEEVLKNVSIQEGERIFYLMDYRGVPIYILDETTLMETGTFEALVAIISIGYCKKLGHKKAAYLKIRKAVGWGDRRLLAAFLPEKDIDRALLIYRRHHRVSLKKCSRILPYSKGVLDYLRGNKIKAAIASNRPTEFTNILLNSLGIKGCFDYVLCADKLVEGKPNPEILLKIMRELKIDPRETLYVGDMVIDVETGRNAGVLVRVPPTRRCLRGT
jgi:HAD superfamily hydrolase (TIGR01549 family)